MRKMQNILVTGGCGFVGSNFIHLTIEKRKFDGLVVNADKLTYAGNPENLSGIGVGPHYRFERADICDYERTEQLLRRYEIDTIVHFAAESHVDRSIYGPKDFIHTNITGTFNLLEAARKYWAGRDDVLFHHVSTVEVFGSLGETGYFTETTPYDPKSPYSASKASSDHLVRAYHHTFDLPVTVTNCSNNYGPYQFPEKLIPLMILNLFEGKPLPVYGDGSNIRDWIYVVDHAEAVWSILDSGETGETYNVGGKNEWKNIDLVNLLCERAAAFEGKDQDHYKKLITLVKDRPGHDRRYAVDCGKIEASLGWSPKVEFQEGLDRTIAWYRENTDWIETTRSGEHRDWIERNYDNR